MIDKKSLYKNGFKHDHVTVVDYLHYPVLIMKSGESICLFLNNFFPKPPVAGRESAGPYAETQYNRAYSSWILYESHLDLKVKHCLDAGRSLGGKTAYYAEKGCKSIIGVDINDKYIEHARQICRGKGHFERSIQSQRNK